MSELASGMDPGRLESNQALDMARSGDTAGLAALIEAGIPVDLADDRGDTLVMSAGYHGHAETVKLLLERGADPNRLNDRGQTPLAVAVLKSRDAVVEELLRHGADPAAGSPSAADAAGVFGYTHYLEWFDAQTTR